MPVRYRRAAFAAVLTAAAVVVPVAAFASGPGSPAAKPAPSAATPAPSAATPASSAAKPAPSATTLKAKSAAGASNSAAISPSSGALASSAGISQSRLDAGLAAAKRAGGNTSAGIAGFAQAAGVSHATAQRIVFAVFGNDGSGARDRIKKSGGRAVMPPSRGTPGGRRRRARPPRCRVPLRDVYRIVSAVAVGIEANSPVWAERPTSAPTRLDHSGSGREQPRGCRR
jgi:predicted enzyme related to lactoylglutathione lyase